MPEPIRLEGSTWAPESICLEGSTWPLEPIRLDKSTWLPVNTSGGVDLGAGANMSAGGRLGYRSRYVLGVDLDDGADTSGGGRHGHWSQYVWTGRVGHRS